MSYQAIQGFKEHSYHFIFFLCRLYTGPWLQADIASPGSIWANFFPSSENVSNDQNGFLIA